MPSVVTYRSVAGDQPLPYIECDRGIRTLYSRIQHYISQDDGNCPCAATCATRSAAAMASSPMPDSSSTRK